MVANVGTADRAFRAVLGVVLIAGALLGGGTVFDGGFLTYGALAVGVVMLATALFRFCPLYTVLGVKTCRG